MTTVDPLDDDEVALGMNTGPMAGVAREAWAGSAPWPQ